MAHSIFGLFDRHGGVALEQFRKPRLAPGLHVLNDDKREIVIRRHMGKELFKRLQPSGRCANADYRKLFFCFGLHAFSWLGGICGQRIRVVFLLVACSLLRTLFILFALNPFSHNSPSMMPYV